MGKLTRFFIASPENDFRPPMLSYRAFLIYGLLLLILRLLLGALPAQSSAVESGTLMALINQERTRRNLASLPAHPALVTAAAAKSQDMIDRDYFAHVDPDGNYVWGRIIAAGYTPYKILGENLAIDFSTSEGMIKAWLDSPTHRANLLHPEFVHQGLTALYGDYQGRYTNLTASLFGALAVSGKTTTRPKPSPSPPPPTPPPAPIYATPQTPPPAAPQPSSPTTPPSARAYSASRVIFTVFGIILLVILAIDAVIINRHDASVGRSRSSYHLMGFLLIILVSILIWWW